MIVAAAILASLAGIGALVAAIRLRRRESDAALVEVLDFARLGVAPEGGGGEDHRRFFEPGVALTNAALERLNLKQAIAARLERGRVPLKPGEFVLIVTVSTVAVALLATLLTGQVLVGGLLALGVWPVALTFLANKAERRRRAFETQLPEALSVVSSSLRAGHTFLHAIEAMVEESDAPMSEEFARVLAESQLGQPLIDSLQRMSDRMQVRDLAWVVQAIGIQQDVGGQLAEVLNTLADFMRAREEVRREVRVLTAEGRLSAIVLGALPVVVFFALQVLNPKYLRPMLQGGGLLALLGAAASTVVGITIIRRMAKVEV